MSVRKATPRGQMTRGANSGPAIMLIPPHIRATFMPNPPLEHVAIPGKRRKQKWTGIASYLVDFEKTPPPPRTLQPTPQSIRQARRQQQQADVQKQLEPQIIEYRQQQKQSGGEFDGMNCYNTLFVGRLAYEVTERKLLREMEAFGPVKDIRIIKDSEGKSRGYAFVDYEHEEDMKRAYRAADAMRVEGREIVVDVERGHTVPSWLPRRLGGGLGGTRLGGREINVTRPGRFDPARPEPGFLTMNGDGGGGGMGRGMEPPMSYGGPPPGPMRGGGGYRDGGPPPPPPALPPRGPYGMGRGGGMDRYGGPPPPSVLPPPMPGQQDRDWDRRKRQRSRSPDRRHGGDRRRRY